MLKIKVIDILFVTIVLSMVIAGFSPFQWQGRLEVWSYLFSAGLICFVVCVSYSTPVIRPHQFSLFLSLILFFVFSSLRTGQLKPLFFLIFLLFFFVRKGFRSNDSTVVMKVVILTGFTLCLVLLFFDSRFSMGEQQRFVGFSISPTVFAVTIQGLMILGLMVFRSKVVRILLVFISLLFVGLSKTRLNFLLFLFIPLISFVERRSTRFRFFALIMFLVVLALVYPIYDHLLNTDFFSQIIGTRYSDGRDASFGLRNALFLQGLNIFTEGSFFELLLGNGAEYSRLAIMEEYGKDLKLHNDLLVLVIDYGILFSTMFIVLFARLGSKNPYSFLAVILYFISFYHNMVLSLFLLIIIYLSAQLDVSTTKDHDILVA